MTALPAKLRTAGYRTVQAGKWHAGLATPSHTPAGRGYEETLSYLDGANDYFNSLTGDWCGSAEWTDLWGHDAPAFGLNNSWACSQDNQMPSCVYADDLYTNFTVSAIARHDPARPLFLYFAPHSVHLGGHGILQVPDSALARFAFINDSIPRQHFAAMTWYIDQKVGAVVAALRSAGLWNNTLFVLTADNGGATFSETGYSCSFCNGGAGGNNWPLRGGKHSAWEGGVRVNGLVAGGALPLAMQGTTITGLVGIEDWYRTFCGLAGVDPFDAAAAAAGLPPVEGFDLWPLLSGANATSPRTEIWIGSDTPFNTSTPGATYVQGIIRADGYKLIWNKNYMAHWWGPLYPNATTAASPWDNSPLDCGASPEASVCLFNVLTDPTEHEELSARHPEIVAELAARIRQLQEGVFSPDRGAPSPLACTASREKWGGFVGPFLP